MRTSLLVTGAVLRGALARLARALYLFSRRILPITLSLVVNVLPFLPNILAIITIWVALQAYWSAEESGAKQEKALNSAREALDSVVAIAQTLRAEELERRARRPKVEISLGAITDAQLRSNALFYVQLKANKSTTFAFVVKNIGTAPLIRPTVIVLARPETIELYEPGFRVRPSANVFQFSGPTVLDIFTTEVNPPGNRYRIESVIPDGVTNFELEFAIVGEGFPMEIRKIRLSAIRAPAAAQ